MRIWSRAGRLPVVAMLAAAALTGAARAEVPRVAADILPVHGLVARVMQGLGEPDLVVPPGASPHGYAMRPSEARALSQADVVFWLGEPLTPWLTDALSELASDAAQVELISAPGTRVMEVRSGALFAADSDHDASDGHDAHADPEVQNDQERHAHEAGHEEDGGQVSEEAKVSLEDGLAHAHTGADPHAWLLPENALVWLDVVAAELAAADPANAEAYAANAAAGKAEIAAAAEEVSAALAPVRERAVIVFHDAYQYFEAGFGLRTAGAIAMSDAASPSPSRIAELRDAAGELGVACVFSEPQFNPGLVAAVAEGSGAGTAVLDPMGSHLEPGAQFYPALLRDLGQAVAACN
ncbi:zinc ABC transporter substrate-binding protein [Cribrihabitans neustonicus]|uniref:zinc ABC transporter substrate-binding protein n=1 Tax=Cribrihabitans neustonicus TaxID=1429085 RepID=UPI003B591ACD